jgi:signal transduction histidine kinase/ActR/RegA family two-component response regulator
VETIGRVGKPRRRLLLRRWIPHVFLVVGCTLSFSAAWFVTSTATARAQAAFLADARHTRQQIQAALDAYVEVIRAGAALLSASNEINHSEFRAFVSGLQLPLRYPAMAGIGFSESVRRPSLPAFLREIDLDGIRRLRVWPPGARPEYEIVILLEPRDGRNQAMLGFDMSTDPARRAAMDRARDTGQPTASGKPVDAQPFDADTVPDLVLYMPVYRSGAPRQGVEERRRALVGFVFSSLRLADLFPRIINSTTPSVAFDVYDGNVGDPQALVYRTSEGTEPSRFRSIESVQMAGRAWRVSVRSLEPPIVVLPEGAGRTLLVGVLLSILLFLIMRFQVRAWETSARHEEELRATDRAKDEFLATLSHELRTPLNAILGWVSMLRSGVLEDAQRTHAIEVIERNARLQTRLIEDLLDVSRILVGKVHLELTPLSLAPIVSTTIESLRPTADAKDVSVAASLLTPEKGRIYGDTARLQQILWNLLSNAIKFTPPGGRVTVEMSESDRHVELCVRDTGIGIAPGFLPHVFERFRQADSSTTRAQTGMGLGLAIARYLVERHGGSIEARSEGLHRGSSFIVRFPIAPALVATSPGASGTRPPSELDGVRVLVVDDDADTRELLSEALRASGARVTTADSAGQAFRRLGADRADVLVSDIGMPEEDGLSLIRRIRSLPGEPGRIPAIALTAAARPEDRARVLEAGYQMYFAKPVELADLQAGLAALTVEIGPDASTAR